MLKSEELPTIWRRSYIAISWLVKRTRPVDQAGLFYYSSREFDHEVGIPPNRFAINNAISR